MSSRNRLRLNLPPCSPGHAHAQPTKDSEETIELHAARDGGCLLEMYIVTPFLHTKQKDAYCLHFCFFASVYLKHKIMMYEPGYLHR